MKLVYEYSGQPVSLEVTRVGDIFELELDGEREEIQPVHLTPPRVSFLFRGRVVTAHVARDGNKRWIHFDGKTFVLGRIDPKSVRSPAQGTPESIGSEDIIAPMPGQVRGVMVQEGEAVTKGQALFLLEAMKMEIKVAAAQDGVAVKIFVAEGQSVERDQVLGRVVGNQEQERLTADPDFAS